MYASSNTDRPHTSSTATRHQDRWIQQTKRALLLLGVALLLGTVVYFVIWRTFSPNPEEHTLLDAAFFAVFTLTTVGYGQCTL